MKFFEMSDYPRPARIFWWGAFVGGAITLSHSLWQTTRFSAFEITQVSLLTLVAVFTSLFPFKIPGTKTAISVSEFFIFLTVLLCGVPAATIVTCAESFAASWKASKRWTSRLGSPAINSLAMLTAGGLFSYLLNLSQARNQFNAAVLLTTMLFFALAYFLVNSMLMSALFALKLKKSMFTIWRQNYVWVSLTYASSASVAGLVYLGFSQFGIAALIAALPILGIVFATCHFYFKQADERERGFHERVALAEKHLEEMQESEERFRSAFDYASVGMALVSPEGRWLQMNTAVGKILGYSEEQLLSADFQSLTHPDDVDIVTRSIAQLLAQEQTSIQLEQRYKHLLGHEVWVLLSASLIRASQTRERCLIFQLHDITDRKRFEAQLLHDAFHDGLTNLPNRALFLDRLKIAMAKMQRHPDRIFAVLFMDCDRFKNINDSLGHGAGDELLVELSRRLEIALRPGDTVARLGGDEFTILVEDIKDANEAMDIAERLQTVLHEPMTLSDNEVRITASIGITMSSTEYEKPEDMLRDADTAMYQAKAVGKARQALFDKSMHARALKSLQLENDLRRAVERKEFFLVYQPLVSLATAQLLGFEALVRWRHPVRGFVSPGDFIPLAEETGLIVPLGAWVLEEACRQMRQWQLQYLGDTPLTMNVNLSGKQLELPNIVEQVNQTLERVGLESHCLKLEITESVVMENIEATIGKLQQIRALGAKLGIDDFGTGYSSLSYLHRMPVNTLKIDRSFVIRMVESEENAEIVRTIVMLAKTLKMDVTAEGIETKEQLGQLRELGAETGQGYFFAKPLEAEAAGQIVRELATWRGFATEEESTLPPEMFDSILTSTARM